jgi:hypothetical protein
VLRQIYDQMPEPKWVISMGVCASTGGMFNNYGLIQGVDTIVPVDIYVPAARPARDADVRDPSLHEKVQKEARSSGRWTERARRAAAAALPRPAGGARARSPSWWPATTCLHARVAPDDPSSASTSCRRELHGLAGSDPRFWLAYHLLSLEHATVCV